MAKKKNNFLLIGLILILVLVIGFSYGYYLLNRVQENNNIVGSKCFKLELASEENNINLNNMYPISDEEGKSLTPYTFTLKNTCDMTASYTLSMEMLEGTTLNSKYVDVMVNNGEIKLLNSYDEANTVLTGSTESRILDKGLLASNTTKDYSIRFWMDKNVEDIDSMNKSFQSKIIVDSTPINYDGQIVYDFGYTGGEQTFTAPVSGTYKLETWGAQGDGWLGGIGGSGGYSSGNIKLYKETKLYVNVGGKGIKKEYNGSGSGGGATHISIESGELYTLSESKLLIVSGGGGAGEHEHGGSAGGYVGSNGFAIDNSYPYYGTGGSQISGGIGVEVSNYPATADINGDFGISGKGYSNIDGGSDGGTGYFGGGGTTLAGGGGGGSGYIGNLLLNNKVMYCYNCVESSEESTKTISTTCNEEIPTSYCAKKEDGYARITLVSIDE